MQIGTQGQPAECRGFLWIMFQVLSGEAEMKVRLEGQVTNRGHTISASPGPTPGST